jgi:hypothetical protein
MRVTSYKDERPLPNPIPYSSVIDVQRAGLVRPWPARAGPGQPAAGRAGPDHTGLRAATSAHGPVRGPFWRATGQSGRLFTGPGYSPLPAGFQKKNLAGLYLAGHSPLPELSRPLLKNRPIPKKTKQAKSTGHHRANRAIGPDCHRATGWGDGPWPARPPGRAARSPQSADRAGPGTGPFWRAMDRATDHGPNGQLYSSVHKRMQFSLFDESNYLNFD